MKHLVKKYSSSNYIQNINGDVEQEGYTAKYDSTKPKNKGVVNTHKNGKKQKHVFEKVDALDKFLGNFGRQKSQTIGDTMQKYIEILDEMTPTKFKKFTEKNGFMKKNLTRSKPKHKKRTRRRHSN